MNCPSCKVAAYQETSGRWWCGNKECVAHLCTVCDTALTHDLVIGFTGAEPVPAPPEPWHIYKPQPMPDGTTFSMHFPGPNEGGVAFTYEEMLALQRVARAQIELEKKRGVNQR